MENLHLAIDRSAYRMSKCGAGVNSDLRNGSSWVEIRDAKNVDRFCWRSTQVWLHQMRSDLKKPYFLECLRVVVSDSSFGDNFCFRRLAGLQTLRASCCPVKQWAWRLQKRLLPRLAVGLGAPQTIIRRPLPSLPSPDQHNNSVHAGRSCGHLVTSSPSSSSVANLSLPTWRLQLSHRHPPMRSRKLFDQSYIQIFEKV